MSNEKEIEDLRKRLAELEKDENAASYAEPARQQSLTFPKGVFKWILLAVILISVAVIASKTNELMAYLPGMQTNEQKSAFVERLQETEELVTAEAYVKSIIQKEDYTKIFKDIRIPGTTRKVLVIFTGKVQAGIDLSGISDSDVELDEANKTATLKVPKPKVLGEPILFMDQVQAYSHTGLLREKLDLTESLEIVAEAQEQMIEEASTQGVLALAEINAEKLLQDMFQLVDYDVIIEFKE